MIALLLAAALAHGHHHGRTPAVQQLPPCTTGTAYTGSSASSYDVVCWQSSNLIQCPTADQRRRVFGLAEGMYEVARDGWWRATAAYTALAHGDASALDDATSSDEDAIDAKRDGDALVATVRAACP